MKNRPFSRATILMLVAAMMTSFATSAPAQTRRNIKVVLQTQETGTGSQEILQGPNGVIIRRGTVQPSGRIIANETRTTVQRSNGIFTLVLDGSESILSVATRVPQSQIAYYHNYATGVGYIERQIIFNNVGTSLRVGATTLPDSQIRLRLTPRISYFSAERPGAIDLTEAASELIVPNGQPVSLGGSTASVHEITRQILGYRDRASGSETSLVVTATVQ